MRFSNASANIKSSVLLICLLILAACESAGLDPAEYPQNYQPPETNNSTNSQSGTPVRSVVIFVHGVNSGPGNYDGWIKNAAKILPNGVWPEDVLIVRFDWGKIDGKEGSTIIGNRADTGTFNGYTHGMGPHPWDASAKLRNIVGKIRYAFGFQVPITIVSHSQGTVITLAALQEGMGIDNWVLMGSSLSQQAIANGDDFTNLGFASGNVFGKIVNYYSSDDYVELFDPGISDPVSISWHIGRVGISSIYNYQKDNIYQDEILWVTHSGDNGWWKGNWINNVLSSSQNDFLAGLIMGNSGDSFFNSDQMSFFRNEVQNYAQSGNPNWWGDGDYDKAEEVFYLTGGMMNGFFFDDKDEASYLVECYQGSVEVQVLEAELWEFNDGSDPKIVPAGSYLPGDYTVNSWIVDGTVWLIVKGIPNTVSVCYVGFEAWDN